VWITLAALLAMLFGVTATAAAVALPSRDNSQRPPPASPSGDEYGDRSSEEESAEGIVTEPPPRQKVAASTIRPGSSGGHVKTLQRKIRSRGVKVKVDGDYGPGTRKAVKAIQRRLGMKPTGIASKAFLKRLGITSFPSATRAGSSKSKYLVVFPMPPSVDYSYSNDYGAPRHQGSHQGNDIIAPLDAPIVSATYGEVERVQRVEKGLGGRYLWIRDTKGNLYYYAHLNKISPGIEVGTEVWPGRVIGTNGNTGDARHGVEHLHFEIRDGGWSNIINPYSHLTAVDPKR
jgi:murein DD-endopeptidase MepM/ murein hydrolase activator NlpD